MGGVLVGGAERLPDLLDNAVIPLAGVEGLVCGAGGAGLGAGPLGGPLPEGNRLS